MTNYIIYISVSSAGSQLTSLFEFALLPAVHRLQNNVLLTPVVAQVLSIFFTSLPNQKIFNESTSFKIK